MDISIHALREEGDPGRQRIYRCRFDISIHALREEGDSSSVTGAGVWADFYPRPPRGGRLSRSIPDYPVMRFLSTPSARRATGRQVDHLHRSRISIHALREEGDCLTSLKGTHESKFLSTPSARRATYHPATPHPDRPISIHALREEGDAPGSWSR